MCDNSKDPQTAVEGHFNDKQLSSRELAEKPVNSSDMGQLAIKNLLKGAPVGVDDKLTTIKAAHHVDKERFQSAFRIFMGDAKS